MKRIWKFACYVLALALALGDSPLAFGPASSMAAQSGAPPTIDAGWPRQFQSGVYAITLYHPQLDSWDYATNLTAHDAVSLKAAGARR